ATRYASTADGCGCSRRSAPSRRSSPVAGSNSKRPKRTRPRSAAGWWSGTRHCRTSPLRAAAQRGASPPPPALKVASLAAGKPANGDHLMPRLIQLATTAAVVLTFVAGPAAANQKVPTLRVKRDGASVRIRAELLSDVIAKPTEGTLLEALD